MPQNDSDERRRAVEETDASFIVEASAGSGKTSTLINRILHLVLNAGPSGKPIRLTQICAITFTEKAAGEMKIRLRHRFEVAAQSTGNAGDVAVEERAREALRDLESASISTFHSFAVSLLKERPIEAGLDPRFTPLDEIRSELFFREVWDQWMGRALADRNPILEKALKNGFTLRTLVDLAETLRANGFALRTLELDAPPNENEIERRMDRLLEEGRSWRRLCTTPDDKLLVHLERALEWLSNPAPECERPSKPGRAGLAAHWTGGKETIEGVQAFVRGVSDVCGERQKLPAQQRLDEVIRWIAGDFIPEWDRQKRSAGLLDFDDQLWLARELLRQNKAVRREFQSRFATLLVDEFQDTDPVQWDIVRLLSASESKEDVGELSSSELARLRPAPGRLFLVGDPKQSIYRFRNADIETYLEVADPRRIGELGLDRLQLTTNFRSVPSILNFVDAAFQDVMKAPEDGAAGRYQPDYLAFGGDGGRREGAQSPSVFLIGKENESGENATVREFLESEAAAMAALIAEMCSSGASDRWKVQDPADETWRSPRFGDIAILLPVLSRADILEDALRRADIPYVLEGGKFYYARSEVASAITVLRAAANPNDNVALYGALRSIFFGLSDEDLLRARMAGTPFDYRAAVPPESPLFHPFGILLDLHRRRHERRASETLEVLLRETGAREVLAARGFQSLANLGKLARTLRSLQENATFSQVVDVLKTMDEEGLAESESRLMEERSNAVRLLSIHKSKGLDFPIVMIAGLGLRKITRFRKFLADFHSTRVFGLSLGGPESGLRTPRFHELAHQERNREQAELVRLLYVALTRARDHMVVSIHTQKWKSLGEGKPSVPVTGGTRLEPLGLFLEKCLTEKHDLVRRVEIADAVSVRPRQSATAAVDADEWRAIIEREYAELGRLLKAPIGVRDGSSVAPGAGERVFDQVENRSVRLGVAFHEIMEQADLLSPESFRGITRGQLVRHGLDSDSAARLNELVRVALSSELLGRVRAALRAGGRALREFPFVRQNEGGAEEGKIDLMFEEAGGWVIVDYKTDWVSDDPADAERFFREKYAAQIQRYVAALERLPVKVAEAYLLLARTGQAVRMQLHAAHAASR